MFWASEIMLHHPLEDMPVFLELLQARSVPQIPGEQQLLSWHPTYPQTLYKAQHLCWQLQTQ
jgi:hypothetical protein